MKQTGFLIEIVAEEGTLPTILIRSAQTGQVVKVTNQVSDVSPFLAECLDKMFPKNNE